KREEECVHCGQTTNSCSCGDNEVAMVQGNTLDTLRLSGASTMVAGIDGEPADFYSTFSCK
ncbi:MAG: hypothetical protein AAB845_00380, partial [Patescibacteria group bacterium]